MHGKGSRNKLTPSHARLYPSDSALDRLGRAVCAAHCLPRKEVHEAWEMALRVRERFPDLRGGRVVDLCAGFGLLAQVMLILDDTSTSAHAICVDVKLPANHRIVHDAIAGAFPRIRGRVRFVQAPLARLDREIELARNDLVVSSHACGSLTDDVIARAVAAGARVAVLPCCHEYRYREDLADSVDPALAIDVERAARLTARGYRVSVATIPEDVSPKNRLLMGAME